MVLDNSARSATVKPVTDTTSVGIRLPDDLLADVDKVAADEHRTRNNAVVVLLTEALTARDARVSEVAP